MTKFTLLTILSLLVLIGQVEAQAPQMIKYQAVARNADGSILSNQDITIRFTINRNAHDGLVFYRENHQITTNQFGLFTLNIGAGNVEQGTFADIPWGSGTYYLKVEMNTGSGYIIMGSSQILSVPYAINAGSVTLTSENGTHYNIKVDNEGNLSAEEIVIDQDGNVYPTVRIGNQVWMAKNLNTGTMINATTGGSNEDGEPTDNGIIEKYCYDNIEANCDTLGGLYKWNEAMNYTETEGTQGICPDGWHIPTEADWDELIAYFPEDSAGYYLQPQGGSGFNALMSGYFENGGFYIDATGTCDEFCFTKYWSSKLYYTTPELITAYSLSKNYTQVGKSYPINNDNQAIKIRCIKNNQPTKKTKIK